MSLKNKTRKSLKKRLQQQQQQKQHQQQKLKKFSKQVFERLESQVELRWIALSFVVIQTSYTYFCHFNKPTATTPTTTSQLRNNAPHIKNMIQAYKNIEHKMAVEIFPKPFRFWFLFFICTFFFFNFWLTKSLKLINIYFINIFFFFKLFLNIF